MARQSTLLSLPVLALGAGALYFMTRKKAPATPGGGGWGVGAAPASQPLVVDGSEQAWNSVKVGAVFFGLNLAFTAVALGAVGGIALSGQSGRAAVRKGIRDLTLRSRRSFMPPSALVIAGWAAIGNAVSWKYFNVGVPIGRRTTK